MFEGWRENVCKPWAETKQGRAEGAGQSKAERKGRGRAGPAASGACANPFPPAPELTRSRLSSPRLPRAARSPSLRFARLGLAAAIMPRLIILCLHRRSRLGPPGPRLVHLAPRRRHPPLSELVSGTRPRAAPPDRAAGGRAGARGLDGRRGPGQAASKAGPRLEVLALGQWDPRGPEGPRTGTLRASAA